MSDLSELMRIAPTTGAGFVGINQKNNELLDVLRQRELEGLISARNQEAQHKAQMQPFELESKRLGNQKSLAELPGVEAKSLQETLKAKAAGETYSSDVQTHIAGNQDKIGGFADNDRQRTANFLSTAGPQLAQVPAPLRAGAFAEMIKQANIKVSAQFMQNMQQLAASNPDALPKTLEALSNKLGQSQMEADPKLRSAAQIAASNRASVERVAELNRSSAERVAQIGAQSRERAAEARKNKVANVVDALKSGRTTYEKAAVALEVEAQFTDDPEEKQKLLTMARTFAQEHLKGKSASQAGKPDVAAAAGLTPRTVETGIGQGGKSPPPIGGPFTDAEKERRYQEWKARQAK